MLVTQYPWWGPSDMKPPKIHEEQWQQAWEYADKRAEAEDEHNDDIIAGWVEKEYEFLCDATGLEPYIY